MDAQRTLGWYRARLGNFTGSEVGRLMQRNKSGDDFGKDAMSYIYEKAAERNMKEEVIADDALFSEYLRQTNVTSKSMQFGIDYEDEARRLYEETTGRRIVETGLCVSQEVPFFASSPDGFFYDEETGERGCIEIKCLGFENFMYYAENVHDWKSLKDTNSKYYYQCLSHIMCTDSNWCDFVFYNPFQKNPLHVVRIKSDAFNRIEITRMIIQANAKIFDLLGLKSDTDESVEKNGKREFFRDAKGRFLSKRDYLRVKYCINGKLDDLAGHIRQDTFKS